MDGRIKEEITSQALASGPLDVSYIFNEQVNIVAIYIKASTTIIETVTITRISRNGTNYNVPLEIRTLNGNSSLIYAPTWRCILKIGDSVRIQCTNANLTGTLYVTSHFEGGINE